jgi:enoyl-CoA hydratase/carnithine racemase
MKEVTFTVEREHLGVITLNRPEKANAMTVDMFQGLVDIYTEAQHRDDVRVLVLTGAGRHFCAGGDVKRPIGGESGQSESSAAVRRRATVVQGVPRSIRALDKPVIAAVNGSAVGAGMDLSLMCDMRVAARSATFAESYLRAGLIPGQGGSYFLPRIVGVAKAMELLITGDTLTADEALQLGIVNHVFDDDGFLGSALDFAARIAASPPVHVQLTKRAIYASQLATLQDSLELSASHMALVQSLEDSREARSAWMEKRSPAFYGW